MHLFKILCYSMDAAKHELDNKQFTATKFFSDNLLLKHLKYTQLVTLYLRLSGRIAKMLNCKNVKHAHSTSADKLQYL